MAWEQVGNAIVFYAHYVASKTGKTGLTVTVDVYRAGSAIVTAASATEVGGGLYSYSLASGSVTVEGEYAAIFKTADTSVDQQWIPALWIVGRAGVEDLDAAVSSRSSHTAANVRTEMDANSTKLANLDAAVSSRSTYAGGAVASVTGNVGGNVTGSVGSLAAQAQTDVQTALTNQGYTTTRAGYLDTLNGLVAAIWDKATSAMTAVGSVGKLIKDNLDATVSSRLASASYTAPDNATISTLNTNVSTLLSRLGAFTGSGVNTVLGMLKALGSKSASTPSDMGGTYDAATDSQEAAIDNAVGGATPAQLWAYASRTLTQSASQVNAAVSGSDITILRGDRVTIHLTGIGSLVGRTKLWMTVKWSASQSDSEAIIQAEETAGLLTLNGATWATATDSVITVTDAATGALTWVLKEAATRQLSAPVAGMVYDIQILTSDGPVTRAAGVVHTTADVTRAIT